MLNEYDRIAFIYDKLVSLVFGKSIHKAQVAFLDKLEDGDKVLIVGGGTGWILEEIFKRIKPSKLIYVEASSEMIKLSEQRNVSKLNHEYIEFIHSDSLLFASNVQFDVIITNFFLDLFTNEELQGWKSQILNLLKPRGFWFVSDFQLVYSSLDSYWQRVFSLFMHRFFKLFTSLRRNQFPNWESLFDDVNLQIIASQSFFRGMIFSKVYSYKDSIT
ncbi:class I SAM-dependent methyltransferase [Sediminitomix flava]|uniref:Ubiquinone/menaquinone biosynthesis C-methylase UbiE n=1 Tax=Sediminitomix flava TaxID=379075 RepID=A0A315ZBG5_SEDFL|nr:class I SAM-dependent methyltransferase [Sediminitomix flava]PWJ42499.1 ubiquinone/menaquinone biosynthesis C-methylase UbiE [Sediminitomix flava]